MAITLDGTTGITTPSTNTTALIVSNNNISSDNSFGFRNRIINGDMIIDQRNDGASVVGNDGVFSVDRWVSYVSASSKFTMQQSSIAPVGFKNSVLITSSAATSLAAGDYYVFEHTIEGYNVSDLGFGASGAGTVTVSFWVRSSLTGIFGGSFKNTATGATRSYPFTYSISAANTWEQKTITVSGDITGTWGSTNGNGLCICFGLGVGTTFSGTANSWANANYLSASGATSVVGTNAATWYITGVQLEAGTVATPFERVDAASSLARCQRYFEQFGPDAINRINLGPAFSDGTTTAVGMFQFMVTKRANPTVSYGGIAAPLRYLRNGTDVTSGSTTLTQLSKYGASTGITGQTGLIAGEAGFFALEPSAILQISSEL